MVDTRPEKPSKASRITDLTEEDLKEWLIKRGHKPYRATQLFQWLYLHRASSWEDMSNISKKFVQEISNHFSISSLPIIKKTEADDGTVKYLQQLDDGHGVESVLLKHDDYYTVCISTQVGCAMACRFCLTATMGLVRDLSAGEIVEQVLNAYQLLPAGQNLRNIVYMGMGEPFNNYHNTIKSLKILLNPHGFGFSARRITVSTSGIVPGIERFAREKMVKPNLAISLNGVTQESRKTLMPVSRRYPLKDLIDACQKFPKESRKRITFEYIMLDGITDSISDAKRLIKLLHGIKAKVNLIPYNEHPQLAFKASSSESVKRFQKYLLDHGMVATLRTSKGQGISAACGQLAVGKNF